MKSQTTSLLLAIFCVLAPALTGDDFFSFSRFPMGVYSSDPHDDEQLETLKAAGFDMIQSYGSSEERYDRILSQAEKHGMKVMFNLNRKLVTEEGGLEKMREVVRRYKNHPALGFWYLYDEPAKKITPEVLKPFYDMLHEEAPDIKVAIVNCWDETWYKYSNVLDIQMIDIYPVRDAVFPEAQIQVVSKFTASAKKLGKPVMFVPQLCCYKSFANTLDPKKYNLQALRFPNSAEMRYMTYGPMSYGLCGLFAYSYYHAIRTGGDQKWFGEVAAPVFREIRAFTELVEKPSEPVTFQRPDDDNYLAAFWKAKEGDGYLLLVNSWPTARTSAQAYLDGYFERDFDLIPWGATRPAPAALVKSKVSVETGMEPWEVMVWKLQPKAEAAAEAEK
ncbi:MAG: hypothetical protein GX574_06545 [Lentisphaerae bacterium]|nr:hypothetical protein [Lentisphaerota bacterium]